MKAKKPYKGAVIVLAILSIVFFVCWGTCLALHMVFDPTGLSFEYLLNFIKTPINFEPMTVLIANIICYALVVIAVVLLVLSFVLIRKKPGTKTVAIIMSILAIIVGVYSMNFVVGYTAEADYSFRGIIEFFNFEKIKLVFDSHPEIAALIFLGAGVYLFAILFFIVLILFVVFGGLYSKKAIAMKKAAQAEIAAEEERKAKEYAEASAPQLAEEVAVDDSFTTVDAEPVPMFTPEPEPEPEPEQVEEKKEEPITASSLASMLREVVREIVKDELAKQPKDERPENDNHSVVGATFGGPLVVQYFNGGIQSAPAPAPVQVEEKKEEPAPKKEEVEEEKEEPAPAPVEEEPVKEEEPVVEEEVAPAEEPVVEEPAPAAEPVIAEEVPHVEEEPVVAEIAKKPIIRIPFEERITTADKDMQDNYNELKNEILSYGVNSRVASGGDSFRLHRKTYVKMTVAGKSLKLYLALDPADYADSKMPIGDAGHKAMYAEIPFVFKVKSGLSMRRAKQLIADAMAKDGLEQGEVGTVNWVKELKAEMKERAKLEKEGKKVAPVEDDDAEEDEEE